MLKLIDLTEFCDDYGIPRSKLRTFKASKRFEEILDLVADKEDLDIEDILKTKRGAYGYTKVHKLIAHYFVLWCKNPRMDTEYFIRYTPTRSFIADIVNDLVFGEIA